MAFERLGGLAEECKYDNQKAVVIGREGGQPIWNLRFADSARRRALAHGPARVASPPDAR